MPSGLVERLDGLGRALTPSLLIVLTILLVAAPVRVPNAIAVTPLLPAIAVHYFSLHEAERVPGWAAFLLGLLFDLVSGGALGVWAAVFVAMRYLIDDNARYFAGHGFAIGWLGFALTCALCLALAWLLVSLVNWTIVDPRPALLQWVVTAALYPPIDWLLGKVAFRRGEQG